MAKPEKGLSSDQKLEIRDEVERRLKELPGETLRIIESEVERRVDAKAAHYSTIIKLVSLLGGALFFTVTGLTWSNLRARIHEVTRMGNEVEITKTNVQNAYFQMTNAVSVASNGVAQIGARLSELEQMTNIVTSQRLKNELAVVAGLKDDVENALMAGLSLSANFGDAVAYDNLRKWATNSESTLANEAAENVQAIEAVHVNMQSPPFEAPVVTNLDSYAAAVRFRPAGERRATIEAIATSTNLGKNEQLKLLTDIALADPTIYGRIDAIESLNKSLGTNLFHFTNSAALRQWSKTNFSQP